MSYEAGNIRTINLSGLGRTQRQKDIQAALARSSSPLLRAAAGFTKPGPFISPKSIAPLAIIAGTAATFLIPGAAPLLLKGAAAGGRLIGRGVKSAGSFVAKQLVPSKPTPQSFFGPPAPAGASIPEGPSIPSGPSIPASGMTTADFVGPPAPSTTADQATPASAGVAAPKGFNPAAVVGIALALLLAFSPKPKVRR